ncbi:pseudouridine synthase [Paraglaciecola polaris]|uniref:tRNA pseudouridine32 synthase n=1 Tax=Paraglaciecola polaris LMG 21857 TaxID=1129793 RepID=K7ACN1_9ALTE|nr:pseudouridine synthase [Paraglaciecola polaris]GAC33115.1 tRNA pseudouridine32 synthase [Paraglaciecola polaris LMG 21857]|tara:strand:- start:22354 stop:23244 length:891 start_codon:yes stop_codon:yes gene_type:complete
MAIARTPSKLSLPQHNPGVSTVLEFLILKFPAISAQVWQQRMADGKVHWHDGGLIHAQTAFTAQQRVYYYREVEREPVIPFAENIIFQDELILVAYKPHFLPVMPGGGYVEECLQNRLRHKCGNQHLQAVHRIDKATAGLVLFSVNPKTRQQYHRLFEAHQIDKTYQAIASTNDKEPAENQQWEIKNRLEKSEPRFLMRIVEGAANSHSRIRCVKRAGDKALFELNPVTGKTHQLRLHMQSLGWPLLNDSYYPNLQPSQPDDFTKPLQLLAQQLAFTDPITEQARRFSSNTELRLD